MKNGGKNKSVYCIQYIYTVNSPVLNQHFLVYIWEPVVDLTLGKLTLHAYCPVFWEGHK